MTTDDDNATTWRDLAGQLTPEQIARFEHAEQLCMTGAHLAFPQNDRSKTVADMLDGVLKEARWEAQQNLTDTHTFGHVPLPPPPHRAVIHRRRPRHITPTVDPQQRGGLSLSPVGL
jgi:hypothetical protein